MAGFRHCLASRAGQGALRGSRAVTTVAAAIGPTWRPASRTGHQARGLSAQHRCAAGPASQGRDPSQQHASERQAGWAEWEVPPLSRSSAENTVARRVDEWAERRLHRRSGSRFSGLPPPRGEGTDPILRHAAQDVRRLGRQGLWQEALAVYAGVSNPDEFLQVAAMSACAKSVQVGKVHELFAAMPKKSVSAYDVLITATGMRDPHKAEMLIGDMKAATVPPDPGIYRTVMDSYGRAHLLEDALRVFDEMREAGVQATVITYQSVMAACARAGDRARALQLLDRMEAEGFQPDAGHFTSLIVSCGMHKDEDMAFRILAKMRERSLQIDAVPYTAILGCISGPRTMEKADEIRHDMRRLRVQPDIFFFNALLKLARDARDFARFRAYVTELDSMGLQRTRATSSRICEMEDMLHAEDTARYAVQDALPPGWAEALDPSTGKLYYWQQADPTNTVTWQRPLS